MRSNAARLLVGFSFVSSSLFFAFLAGTSPTDGHDVPEQVPRDEQAERRGDVGDSATVRVGLFSLFARFRIFERTLGDRGRRRRHGGSRRVVSRAHASVARAERLASDLLGRITTSVSTTISSAAAAGTPRRDARSDGFLGSGGRGPRRRDRRRGRRGRREPSASRAAGVVIRVVSSRNSLFPFLRQPLLLRRAQAPPGAIRGRGVPRALGVAVHDQGRAAPPAPRPTSFPVLMVANIVDIGTLGRRRDRWPGTRPRLTPRADARARQDDRSPRRAETKTAIFCPCPSRAFRWESQSTLHTNPATSSATPVAAANVPTSVVQMSFAQGFPTPLLGVAAGVPLRPERSAPCTSCNRAEERDADGEFTPPTIDATTKHRERLERLLVPPSHAVELPGFRVRARGVHRRKGRAS